MQKPRSMGLPRWYRGKESTCQCRRNKRSGFNPWVRKISWRRAWKPSPVFLLGASHGQRNLGGYSPCCHKESDTTEGLTQRHAAMLRMNPTIALVTDCGESPWQMSQIPSYQPFLLPALCGPWPWPFTQSLVFPVSIGGVVNVGADVKKVSLQHLPDP